MLLREEEGYDVRDGEHLSEMIKNAAAGDVTVSMERAQRDKRCRPGRQHRDRIRAQAKNTGVKVVGVKFSVLEGRVLFIEQRRHRRTVELLSDRDKARFDAAVAQSEGLVSNVMKFGLSLTTWLSAGSLVEMCGKRRLYFNASSRKTLGSNRYKGGLRTVQKIVPPAKNRNGSKTLTTEQITNLAMEERMLR